MIVVDASAAIDLLLGSPLAAFVDRHLTEYRQRHAPALIDAEVAAFLRRIDRSDASEREIGARRLDLLTKMVGTPHPVRPLIARAWEMRANLTIGDGIYVALAEALNAPLLTTDARLARGAGAVSEATIIAP